MLRCSVSRVFQKKIQDNFFVLRTKVLLVPGSFFKKLQNKGIKGRSLESFKSYLTGRRQVVDVNGHKSSPEPIDMSVIKGSILGPILFLVYIDDLPSSSLLETFLFADDTQGLKAGKNLPDLIDCVNS